MTIGNKKKISFFANFRRLVECSARLNILAPVRVTSDFKITFDNLMFDIIPISLLNPYQVKNFVTINYNVVKTFTKILS